MKGFKQLLKNLIITGWFGISLLFATGCEDDAKVLQPSTFSNKLTGDSSKSWLRVSRSLVVETNEGKDTFNLDIGLPPCARDDLYTFFKEGHLFEFSEGNTKCDDEGEDVYARGTWEINNANATLILGQEQSYDLVELTDDKLIYGFETSVPLAGRHRPVPGFLFYTYVPE